MESKLKDAVYNSLNINTDKSIDDNTKQRLLNTYYIFKDSISTWPKTKVEKSNIFINKNLNNQLKRLNKYGLTVDNYSDYNVDIYENSEKDENVASIIQIYLDVLNNSNFVFKNQTFMATGIKSTKYYLNNRLIKNIKYRNRTYITVTEVNNNNEILKEEYSCPNCGNVVPIGELLEGCKYCRTKFLISDLYPVVTNYYNCDLKKENIPFFPIFLISSVVFIIILMNTNVVENVLGDSLKTDLWMSPEVASIAFGIVIAFFVSIMIKVFGTFLLFGKYIGDKNIKKYKYRNLENFIRQTDSNFTYYMFEGKIISMIKEAIFCDDCKKLNIYEGTKIFDFSNIIDTDFEEMYIKNFYIKDDCYYIDLELDLFNTIYKNGKITRKEQVMCATVARKTNVITPSTFRVENVKCKSCGGNIDLINNNTCSYCKSKYDYKDYDFVIKDLYLK